MSESQNLYFTKTKREIPLSIIADEKLLELLFTIENENDIKKVSQRMQMPSSDFKKALLKLVDLGLVKKLDASDVYTGNAMIQKIRHKLNQIDGLLGDIVLDDTAKILDMDPDKIPLLELPFFVENLSNKIPSQRNRYRFKKWILAELKALFSYNDPAMV